MYQSRATHTASEHLGYKTSEVREYVGHNARQAQQQLRYVAHEARAHGKH